MRSSIYHPKHDFEEFVRATRPTFLCASTTTSTPSKIIIANRAFLTWAAQSLRNIWAKNCNPTVGWLSVCSRSITHDSPALRLHNPILVGQTMLWRDYQCHFGVPMTTSLPLTASESLAVTGEVKKLNRVRKIWRMYTVELYTVFSDVRSTLVPKMVWTIRVHSVPERNLHYVDIMIYSSIDKSSKS